jgi:hypothetical protein
VIGSRGSLALALLIVPRLALAHPVVHEERAVVVDGEREVWRLVWRAPPQRGMSFDPSEPEGLVGELDLVRLRNGREIDRLALTPLFSLWDGGGARRRPAVLPARDVAARVLELADYDHDGRATEFVLQIDRMDSSIRPAVLVGLDAATRKLKVYGTVKRPASPLVLYYPELWHKLRATPAVRTVALHCGDHGGEFEEVLSLVATRTGLDATLEHYACLADGRRGQATGRDRL